MFRKINGFLIALILLITCCGCSDLSSRKVLRISHSYSRSHPVHEALLELKNYINGQTDTLEVLVYSGNELGSMNSQVVSLQAGSIEMAIVESRLLQNYHPVYEIFSLPFLFSAEEVFLELMNQAEMQAYMSDPAVSEGFIPVAWISDGFVDFYASRDLFNDKNGLEGFQADVYPYSLNVEILELLGGKAYEIDQEEIYLALQTGIINGLETNAYSLYGSELESLLKYASIDHHQLSTSFLIADTETLNSLKDEQKRILETALAAFQEKVNESYKKTRDEAVLKLSENLIYHDRIREELFGVVAPVYERFLEKYPRYEELIDWVNDLNKEYEKD